MDGSGVVNLNNGTEDNNWEPFREKVWATALAVAKLDPQSQVLPPSRASQRTNETLRSG
jgi:hypothetical protein